MIANRLTIISISLAASLGFCVLKAAPALAESVPAIQLKTAPLVTPATAWPYYTASTTHTTGAAAISGRAPEIKEIARALGSGRYTATVYADAIYEYVRNNIETEFRFGLSKGARGALIDQSGTAFDQASLMVELLREGGITASYQVGTVTLNATQFSSWTGLTNAAAACQFLADGGIPATVNGATSCSGLTGTVSSVVMGHVWVSANSRLYDPAYKKYIAKSGLNLSTIISCGTSCGSNVLTSIPAIVTYPGTTAPSVASANQTTIDSNLKTYATSLQTYVQNYNATNKVNLQIEDVVGGASIDISTPPSGAASLPYTTTVQFTWTGDIPDQFRTTLRVQYDTINQLLYADELYGQRLRLWGGQVTQADIDGSTSTTAGRTIALYVEYKPLAKSHNAAGGANDPVTLTVNHPYSANSGTYADDQISFITSLQARFCETSGSGCTSGDKVWAFAPVTIIQGWGNVTDSSISHFTELQRKDLLATVPENPTDPNHVWLSFSTVFPIHCLPTSSLPTRTYDFGCFGTQQAALGATYLAESAVMQKLAARINGGVAQNHHTLGTITSGQTIAGVSLNLQAMVSVNSSTAVAVDRQSAFYGIAASMSRLEAGLTEQTLDAYDGFSGTSMLARSSAKNIALLQVNAANWAGVKSKLTNYDTNKIAVIECYLGIGTGCSAAASLNYSLLVPQNGNLGTISNANILFNGIGGYDASESRITYIVGNSLKGSGSTGAIDPQQSATESTKIRDYSIKKKQYYGVQLQNANLKLTPPPELVTGTGDFPYSLSFQRYYDSSVPLVDGMTPALVAIPYLSYERANLGGGWKHNWSIASQIASDGLAGLGRNSALDASAAITGLYTLRQLTTTTQDLKARLATIMVGDWWVRQLNANVVNIRRPPNNTVFTRLPDGTFNPPPGTAEILRQTGERQLYSGLVWDYRSVNFTLNPKDGSTLNLNFNRDSQAVTYREREPSTWTFLHGVTVSFSYGNSSDNLELQVSNNLGRKLTFDTNETNIFMKVADETGRAVNITATPHPDMGSLTVQCVAALGCIPKTYTVTTPDGAANNYEYTLYPGTPVNRPHIRIGKWFTPTDSVNPFLTVNYDSLYRVKSITDNSSPTRTTNYFVSGLYGSENQKRGESVDQLNARTTQYFDRYNSLLASTSPAGYTTYYSYDTHRRLTKTTYPEGNAVAYTYDARSNRLTETNTTKPGSSQSQIQTKTTYRIGADIATCPSDPTTFADCNLPSSTTDANGNTTNYVSFYGLVTSVTGPASIGSKTSYCYNYLNSSNLFVLVPYAKIEKVSGTVSRVTSYTYNGSNKYVLNTVTVDPSTTYIDGTCATQSKSGALNLVTAFTFDNIGNVTAVDPPRTDVSDATTYNYDTMRRLTRTLAVAGSTTSITRYTYDQDGLLRTTRRGLVTAPTDSNPSNPFPTDLVASQWQTETRDYFANGELKTVTDAELNATQYTYDAAGRVDIVTDPDGRKTKTDYDADGLTLRTWKGWGSTQAGMPIRFAQYTYSPNHKQLSVQDANSNQTDFGYDGQDRLTFTAFPSPANGTRCTLPSFAQGAPTCTGAQTYEAQWYSVDGTPTGARCNGSDAPCRKRNRNGDISTFSYDALNRQTSKAVPGEPTVTYGYNLLSEPTSLSTPANGSDPAHSIAYDYDAAGRKLFEKTDNRQVSYQYDADGNRSRTTWPDSFYVTYAYDSLNRMTTVRENSTTANEIAFYGYDQLSRRASLRLGGQTTNTVTYTYEPDSDLDLLTHKLNAVTVTLNQDHNKSHQLTTLTASDDFYLGPTQPLATLVTYGVNNLNQYTSLTLRSMSYDNNGNLTSWAPTTLNRHTYVFDAENRLKTAAVNSATSPSIFYDYDPLGRRVSKTVSGTQTLYLLDGDEEIAELSSTGAVLRRFITGPAIDDRIATVEGSATAPTAAAHTYYHVNHQGSVIAMTDNLGNVTGCTAGTNCQRLSYDEYGNIPTSVATTGQPYRFTGRRFDPETGLYYYRARYYSPDLGRFLSTDPVGYKTDINLYAYTGNDPLNKTDPKGMCPICLAPAVPAAVEFGATALAYVTGAIVTWVLNEDAKENAPSIPSNSPPDVPKSPVINPQDIAGKTPSEIDKIAKSAGLQPKGPDPTTGKGSYVDPITGKQRILTHPNPEDPSKGHSHVNDPEGNRLDIHGNKVDPEAPEAHLPLKQNTPSGAVQPDTGKNLSIESFRSCNGSFDTLFGSGKCL